MFGFNTMQIAGFAVMAGAGVVMGGPSLGAFLERLKGGSSSGPVVESSSRANGLGENDLKRADGLCFELAAIARKSRNSSQRTTILANVHAIEGALTIEAPQTVAGREPGWLGTDDAPKEINGG